MNLIAAIHELNQIVDLTKRIEKLIEYLESYVQHNSSELVQKQERILRRHIETIMLHLKKVESSLKDHSHLKELVHKEAEIFYDLEKYIVDIAEHPDHLRHDAEVIKKLEIFLERIEIEEMDKERIL